MERDVILAHEIQVLGGCPVFRNGPPILPSINSIKVASTISVPFRPNTRAGVVTLDCFKPDVYSFPIISIYRNRDSPVNVSGDCSVVELAFQVSDREVLDVGFPMFLKTYPFQ